MGSIRHSEKNRGFVLGSMKRVLRPLEWALLRGFPGWLVQKNTCSAPFCSRRIAALTPCLILCRVPDQEFMTTRVGDDTPWEAVGGGGCHGRPVGAHRCHAARGRGVARANVRFAGFNRAHGVPAKGALGSTSGSYVETFTSRWGIIELGGRKRKRGWLPTPAGRRTPHHVPTSRTYARTHAHTPAPPRKCGFWNTTTNWNKCSRACTRL